MNSFLVRVMGLEPIRRLTHAPQTCLSAYSSTLALAVFPDCFNIISDIFGFVNPFFEIFSDFFEITAIRPCCVVFHGVLQRIPKELPSIPPP